MAAVVLGREQRTPSHAVSLLHRALMEKGMHMAPTLLPSTPREGHHAVFLPPAPQGTPWESKEEEEEEEEVGWEGKEYAITSEEPPLPLVLVPPLTHTAPEAQTAERMP
jgi:hypothetical protein